MTDHVDHIALWDDHVYALTYKNKRAWLRSQGRLVNVITEPRPSCLDNPKVSVTVRLRAINVADDEQWINGVKVQAIRGKHQTMYYVWLHDKRECLTFEAAVSALADRSGREADE